LLELGNEDPGDQGYLLDGKIYRALLEYFLEKYGPVIGPRVTQANIFFRAVILNNINLFFAKYRCDYDDYYGVAGKKVW
jgi:hypothetical protein